MINWQIRPAEARDGDILKALWRYAFHSDGEAFVKWYFDTYHRFSETMVATAPSGEVVASLQSIELQLGKKGQVLNTAYVVGVDAFPEVRGQGAVAALMQAALADSPHQGLLLMPFEGAFYRPMGFRYINHHGHLESPMADLYAHSAKTDLHLMRFALDKAPISRLDEIYRAWQDDRYSFFVKRDSRRWKAVLDDLQLEGGYGVLVDDGRDNLGYLLYNLQDDAFFIREMAYRSEEARQALYRYVTGHRSQLARVSWSAPLDEPAVAQPAAGKLAVAYEPFMMWRFLSPACLPFFADRGPESPLCFAFQDDFLSRKSVWQWDQRGLYEATDARPAFSVTPALLSEMVFGSGSVRLPGDATAPRARAQWEALRDLFPRRPLLYINEYF